MNYNTLPQIQNHPTKKKEPKRGKRQIEEKRSQKSQYHTMLVNSLNIPSVIAFESN